MDSFRDRWVAVGIIALSLLAHAQPSNQAGEARPLPPTIECTAYRYQGVDTCAPSGSAPAAPSRVGSNNLDQCQSTNEHESCLVLGLNDHLRIKTKEDLREWLKQKQNNPWKLILFLNERPMRGLHPLAVDVSSNTILFKLIRDSTNEQQKAMWDDLLGRATRFGDQQTGAWQKAGLVRTVRASVGLENGDVAGESSAKFNLVVIHRWWMYGYLAIFGLALFGFCYAAKSTNLLRDSGLPSNLSRPKYSLARTQIAVWTFLTLLAYAFLWMLTGDRNIDIPGNLLVLMGISASTFLASVAIDKSKQEDANIQLPDLKSQQVELEKAIATGNADTITIKTPQLEAVKRRIATLEAGLKPPASRRFDLDLLSDTDGISLHRLQIVCWTLLLTVIFVRTVLDTLALPAFSTTLLGLLGISAGTYVGFKFPEQKG